MRRLVIAIDCDDVLVPTAHWIVDTYNATYGTSIDVKDFYTNDLAIWETTTHEEASARVGALLKTPEYAMVEPFSDAVSVIQRLAKEHELHLVTGRAKYLEPVTHAMLEGKFPGCFVSVEHTGYFEGEKRGKGEVCAQLNADILVDDHVVHLQDVLAAGLKEVILFGDYPWNQAAENLPVGAKRCMDWFEVEKEVERIASN